MKNADASSLPPAHAFRTWLTAGPDDIDHMGHVNNVVYVRWVQEVAQAHWRLVADEGMMQRYSWVLLRHEIDYLHAVFAGDAIVGYTWVGEHHGARFDRFVKLTDASGTKVLASSKTTWCLLDAVTLRPRRIEGDLIAALERQA